MSEFLENLKKAADNGEFNSEAAKKILEVHNLADAKLRGKDVVVELDKIKESLKKRTEATVSEEVKINKPVTEEEIIELNSAYEKQMVAIKKNDMVNTQLATLMEIEDMVKASVEDMFSFINEIEFKFQKEFQDEDPILEDLSTKLKELRKIYNSIIN
jgi:hypothetical protein